VGVCYYTCEHYYQIQLIYFKGERAMNVLSEDLVKRIRGGFVEYSESCIRTEAEKELQKEIIEKLSEETLIDKQILKKLVVMYHKGNGEEEKQKFEEIFLMYDSIRGK